MKITKAGILALCLCAVPRMVSAQTMQFTDKGYVSVNFGAQVGSRTLETNSSFPLYDETATLSTSQEVKGGAFFDIGGAYRVWGKNLLAGVTYSHTSSDSNIAFTAIVPDKVVSDIPRTVTGSQGGAKHSEDTVHIAAIWMIPVANKLDIGIFGGPSIFAVKQDTAGSATVTEPPLAVNLQVNRVSRTTVGVNLGVDAQYLIGKKWGVGGIARYSVGSVNIPDAGDLTVGGFQIGVGGRYRF